MKLPFAPLVDAFGPVYQKRLVTDNGNPWHSHRPEDWQPVMGAPTGAMAELIGVSSRTLNRWSRNGIDEYEADRIAVMLGLHPSAIWSDWFISAEVSPTISTMVA